MFERVIKNILDERVTELVTGFEGSNALLRRQLEIPGMTEAEIDSMVTFFKSDKGRPHTIHQFARKGANPPMWSLVLINEDQSGHYLGDALGHDPELLEQCNFVLDELKDELGYEVDADVSRWQYTYQLYTYAESPDVCLAYYKIARGILVGAKHDLIAAGAEEPKFAGSDLIPDPRYLADNIFARQLTINLWAHVIEPTNVDLGPLAIGRAKTVAGVHVDDNVLGVTAGITVNVEEED